MKSIRKMLAGISLAAALTLSSGMLAFSASAASSAGWHKNEDGYYYTLEDGDKVTGWQKIGNSKFYFGNDGIAVTGFKKIKGNVYYFDPDNRGRMVTGWKVIDDSIYYFGSDGIMRTGWRTISGKTFYFSSSGKAATGTVKINGVSYTFSSKGVLQKTSSNSKSSSSDSSTSTEKSAIYAANPFGNASLGMTSAQVVKANKISNYITLGETNDYRIIGCKPSSYLGASSDETIVMFVFDKSDKLFAVMAVDFNGESGSYWKKYAVKKFGAALEEENGLVLYGDVSTNEIAVIGSYNNADAFVEMNADNVDLMYDALNTALSNYSS